MQDRHLFEYAVIRIVPRVEREEFLNAGVIVYCSKLRFLHAKFDMNEEKIRAFCKKTDITEVQKNLDAYDRISKGDLMAGPIAKLDMASRFRWLTATRSTVVQSSKVHPGYTIDPEATLKKLFEELVL